MTTALSLFLIFILYSANRAQYSMLGNTIEPLVIESPPEDIQPVEVVPHGEFIPAVRDMCETAPWTPGLNFVCGDMYEGLRVMYTNLQLTIIDMVGLAMLLFTS